MIVLGNRLYSFGQLGFHFMYNNLLLCDVKILLDGKV